MINKVLKYKFALLRGANVGEKKLPQLGAPDASLIIYDTHFNLLYFHFTNIFIY